MGIFRGRPSIMHLIRGVAINRKVEAVPVVKRRVLVRVGFNLPRVVPLWP